MTGAERWTEASGLRIRYLDNAPRDPVGLPILFSPGFTDVAEEYEALLEFFAPRRVLVVEVRGRGRSDAPPSGYAAQDHVRDLAAVLENEQIERFHLMTFSRGTTWGLDLVLTEPSRVATISIGDYWMREHAVGPEIADQILLSRFRGRPLADRVQPHVPAELFGASRNRDLCGEIAATGLPVLVATGTEPGCILGPDDLLEVRDRVPGAEFVEIPGASHDLFRQDRLAYPRAVAEFITRRCPGT
jgi:pimeloyl-ACP methyl ester carboxylesterase